MKPTLRTRSRVAVWAVRAVNGLSRRLGRGSGTVAGGRVGLRLDPTLLSALARGRSIILVSGTNGKTTTSAMVREAWGGAVAANVTGANMPAGHVAALVSSSASRAVLETDEAWLPSVIAASSPAVVVLLNLSRDQMDRANEVRQMAQRWRDSLQPTVFTRGVVVANASDPLVVYAAEVATNVRWISTPHAWHADAASCPHCTRALHFESTGWRCDCGFAEPELTASKVHEDGSVTDATGTSTVALELPGVFNHVNAAFALLAVAEAGGVEAGSRARLSSLATVQGRYGLREWRGRRFRLLLAKNPAGASVLLDDLDDDDDVWVAINANVADGKDPSWLYDAPFEALRGRTVVCLGQRRLDLATRLWYGGVAAEVVDDPSTVASSSRPLTIIANYTAFREWMELSTPC